MLRIRFLGMAGRNKHRSAQPVGLLPLDDAVASRPVYVIVSGSDWRADGRTETLLEPAKTVRGRLYVSTGSPLEPMGELSNGPIPTPYVPLTPIPGVEKFPCQISPNRLEVDENVNRAHYRMHWLDVK